MMTAAVMVMITVPMGVATNKKIKNQEKHKIGAFLGFQLILLTMFLFEAELFFLLFWRFKSVSSAAALNS